MQPVIFNPDNTDQFTETAPFEFCNKELQKVSKQNACGIVVKFEDGTKGFYPKVVIKNWNLL